MSSTAVVERAPAARVEWIVLDEPPSEPHRFPGGQLRLSDILELNPPTIVESQHELRFGSRSYTNRQARFIERATSEREALPGRPLSIDD
jgi:hypothetical protein